MIKKIIFFIPNIDDGGIEKNLIILGNYFFNNGHKVDIIYSRISLNVKKKINKKINLIKINNYLNFFFLNTRVNNAINAFLYSLVKIKFNKNSVLFSMQDHPFGIMLGFFKNIPSIIRIANHPVGSLKFFNSYIIFKLKLFIKIFFYNFASVIICNSRKSSKYLKKKIIFQKKIYCIYNPIKKKIIKKSYKRNRYELVTIGRLEKQKNLKGLIKAISIVIEKFDKIKLTIVGKGSEKKKLINLVKNLKLEKNITFINFAKPNKFLYQKGILILNSLFEGLPNILIEGIQHKIPIISTKCESGPDEILKNGQFGTLTKVNNSNDVSEKIKNIINNYPKAINKAKIAFKSLNRFEENKQCQKYIKIIKSL